MFRALLYSDANIHPREALDMTPTELALALDAPEPGKPMPPSGSIVHKLPQEREAYHRWRASLTPRQRLEVARYGRVLTETKGGEQ